MGAPNSNFNGSSGLADWLPLLGSILHALGGAEALPPADEAEADSGQDAPAGRPTVRRR